MLETFKNALTHNNKHARSIKSYSEDRMEGLYGNRCFSQELLNKFQPKLRRDILMKFLCYYVKTGEIVSQIRPLPIYHNLKFNLILSFYSIKIRHQYTSRLVSVYNTDIGIKHRTKRVFKVRHIEIEI